MLNENLNQPQLVKVVTSTFSPNHQILLQDSKRQTSQIPKTSILIFTKETHIGTEKTGAIKFNTIKKHKHTKKNINKIPKIKNPWNSNPEMNDPTFCVTPKSVAHKDHRKKRGNGMKTKHTVDSKKQIQNITAID